MGCLDDRIPEAEPSHAIENFRIAADFRRVNFTGWCFRTATSPNGGSGSLVAVPEAGRRTGKNRREVIELIASAQCKDGYLNTYLR